MNNDLKDILSNSNKDIDNQKLMDYLSNQLNDPEQHDVEKNMASDDFTNDAIEGLQRFEAKKDIAEYVSQLNKGLHKQTKKKRRINRRWKDNPWIYLAVVLVLILLIISYIVVRKYIG